MKALKIDALMLTHPPDLAYLTNFTGDDSIGLVAEKDIHLITDFRYEEQAQIEAGWLKMTIRDAKMEAALIKAIAAAKSKRIGFEANFATVGQIDAPGVRVELVPWNLEREPEDFAACDIGLYPLVEYAWSLGKYGLKAVQYMACGVPFVASPVGVTVEMVRREAGTVWLLALGAK
jgi:glycosyltransferase involved in cell wall biosynthesis